MSPKRLVRFSRPRSGDRAWMRRALALAARGVGLTAPNPHVGAVLVRDGAVVGEGAHMQAGGPHAEAAALAAAGPSARGATCYSTLEPCAHRGRTPPCADALIAAGVTRVVAACPDPNPLVDGAGFQRLRAAGVEVTIGLLEREARALNRAFFIAVTRGRPHVTLKTAMTLDGRIAASDGASQWITGEAARLEAHRMRFAADAILVGVETVLRDDPRLTVRLPGAPPKEPWRVVADSRLRTPPDARLVTAGLPERAIIACVGPAPAERATALRATGARVVELDGEDGRVDLRGLLRVLAELGVTGVLVEGGAELGAGLVEHRLVDRVAFFIAPRLLGGRGAPGPIGGRGLGLKDTVMLTGVTHRKIGEDLLVEADVTV